MIPRKLWRDRAFRLLLCAGFAALLTGLVLWFSFRRGRLSLYLRLDDIGYISDGMLRLTKLETGGWHAVWRDYLDRPPHSPYSDFFAMASLATLGKHDWAPYAANGLLALAFFISADYLLKGLKLCQKACCFVFLGSIPLMGMAVHEFLPDFAVALATSMGILLLLTRPFSQSSARCKLMIGVLFGLALLGKPPVFPATLAFFLAAATLASLYDRFALGNRPGIGQVIKSWMLCLTPLVLIALPHYLVNGPQIWSYIHEAQFGGHQKVWAKNGWTVAKHLEHYLVGESGRAMFGRDLWVLIPLMLFGWFETVRLRRRKDCILGAALAIMVVLTWLFPTVNPHKQMYLGLTFQVFVVMLAMYEIRRIILDNPRPRPRLWPDVLPIGLAVLGPVFFRWPEFARYSPAERKNRIDVVKGAYDAIAAGGKNATAKPLVIINGNGDINASLYQYFALRDSLPMDVTTPPDTNDVTIYAPRFNEATFIVAADPNSGVFAAFLLNAQIQGELLDQVRARTDFQEVFSHMGAGHHSFVWIDPGLHLHVYPSVYVFQRKR